MSMVRRIPLVSLAVLTACTQDISAPAAAPLSQVETPSSAALLTPAASNPFGLYVGNLATWGGDPPTFPLYTKGPALLDTLVYNNIGWLRLGVRWGTIEQYEPAAAAFAASAVDESGQLRQTILTLQWARDRGMRAYVQIHLYPPAWARGIYTDPEQDEYGPACDRFDDWEAFVQRFVDAVDSLGVRHYAIHNEPSDPTQFQSQYCMGSTHGYLNDYEDIVRRAARVIHAKRPGENKVLFWEQGGTFPFQPPGSAIPTAMASAARLASVAAAAGEPDPVDIFAIHNYSPPNTSQTLIQAAKGVTDEMDLWAIATSKDLWLTEYGGPEMDTTYAGPSGLTTERGQRNFHSVVISRFIMYRPPEWKMIFPFNDEQRYVFTKDFQWKPMMNLPFTTHEPLWAYGYLARRYGGDYGIKYSGYRYDSGIWNNATDWGVVGPTSSVSGLWGIGQDINPRLRRAGVQLCSRYYLSFIGWLQSGPYGPLWCNGEQHGPIEFNNQQHSVESFKMLFQNPLPTYYLGWTVLCAKARRNGEAWSAQQCSGGSPTSVESGQVLPISTLVPMQQFYMWIGGDVP